MAETEINEQAARTIAAGMKQVASVDGDHPHEMALITGFESELTGQSDTVDLSTLHNPALKDVFLRSLALVAVADGGISPEEHQVISDYAQKLGFGEDKVADVLRDVAEVLLSAFAGVQVFKDEVVEIGHQIGLEDAEIEDALKNQD